MVFFNIKNLQVQFHRTYFNIYITETELVKSNLLATISWMSTEWSVSFEYRITGVVSSWGSIVHLTIGSNIVQMGQRTTAVFTLPNSQKLIFNTTLNDETNYICRSVENLELWIASTRLKFINDTSAMESIDTSSKLMEKRFTQLSTAKQDNSTMSKFTHQIHRSTHHKDLFQNFILQTFFKS